MYEKLLEKHYRNAEWRTFIVYIAIIFVVVGVSSNLVAIRQNNGFMPVYALGNITYCYPDNLHYYFNDTSTNISDIAFTDIYFFNNSVYSIGDFLILTGFFILLVMMLWQITEGIIFKKEKKRLLYGY